MQLPLRPNAEHNGVDCSAKCVAVKRNAARLTMTRLRKYSVGCCFLFFVTA